MNKPGMCPPATRLRATCGPFVMLLCVVVGIGAPTVADAASVPSAHTARVVSLRETGELKLTSRGNTITALGRAKGTYDCAITVSLEVFTFTNRVSAKFTVDPTGGTISGKGSARYAVEGEYGYFGGTIAITHGTGRYSHAAGKEIGISGKINRETFVLSVHVRGTMHL
jgi:hypothetical protein